MKDAKRTKLNVGPRKGEKTIPKIPEVQDLTPYEPNKEGG